jgi:hypothetical protein
MRKLLLHGLQDLLAVGQLGHHFGIHKTGHIKSGQPISHQTPNLFNFQLSRNNLLPDRLKAIPRRDLDDPDSFHQAKEREKEKKRKRKKKKKTTIPSCLAETLSGD